MNVRLIALVTISLVIGAGLGYSILMVQTAILQARASELETKIAVLTNNYNNLGAEHNQLEDSLELLSAKCISLNASDFEKGILIQSLQQQVNSLNNTYLSLLQQYEDLRTRMLQREVYIVEETQNVTINAVPTGIRRHYTLINIPIPEDAGQDVALVHYDKDGRLIAVPFYYFMDINATGKGVVSSGYFPFPCQILEYRIGENSDIGHLYIQTAHMPTEQGYVCEAGDHLAVMFFTSPKALAEVTVAYWDEEA